MSGTFAGTIGPGTARARTFDPRDYGPVDLTGAVASTAAMATAVAALNAAGRGTLYIPPGNILTAGGHVISVPFTLAGEGSAGISDTAGAYVSRITCPSATADLFTTTGGVGRFEGVSLQNSAATVTAGSAVKVAGTAQGPRVHYEDVTISDFWIGIDMQAGGFWDMHNVLVISPWKYGIRIQNLINQDWADWSMEAVSVFAYGRPADAGIRIQSMDGGKIVNCKIVGTATGNGFLHGIDIAPGPQAPPLYYILLIANCSIEGSRGNGINGVLAPMDLAITNCQIHNYDNVTGHAIELDGSGWAPTGAISNVMISNIIATNNGGSSAVRLSSVRDGVVSGIIVAPAGSFASKLEMVGCNNVIDATGGVASGVQITGTPEVGQVPIATSATTAAWGTLP